MCEIPKIPKIYDYNRDKMGITQKRGRLDQKHRGTNFAMHSEFRYHSENTRHSENSNFHYAQ